MRRWWCREELAGDKNHLPHKKTALPGLRHLTEAGGREAHLPPEGRREMALIGEPAGHRDFRQRHVGVRYQVAGMLDAFAAKIFADGGRELTSEFAREMHAVHARGTRDLGQA